MSGKHKDMKKEAVIVGLLAQWKKDKQEGKTLSIEDYLEKCPEHTEELREEIETSELIEKMFAIAGREGTLTEEEEKEDLERLFAGMDVEEGKMADLSSETKT